MFKIGENVICTKNDNYLTKYKSYKIIQIHENFNNEILLNLTVNDNITQWYYIGDFMSVTEYRKQKLKRLNNV